MRKLGEEVRAKREEARLAKEAGLRKAADIVLGTESGRILWKHFFNLSGYRHRSVAMNNQGDISNNNTLYNDARRSLYIEMRRMPSFSILAEVEQKAEEELLKSEVKKEEEPNG